MALVKIEKYFLYDSIKNYLKNDMPWHQTEYYERRISSDHTLRKSKKDLKKL